MNLLKSCAAAFRFLTIMPLPGSFGANEEDLVHATFFFPVVGLVLGLIAAGAAWVLWTFLPPLSAAVLLVFLLLSVSGALHLDGLADTADGFFSSRDRERTLEIMRDSRTGVMGVAAVVLLVLLKVSALVSLQKDAAMHIAFLMPLAGRCGLLIMMFMLPYVRPDGGLGTRFFSRSSGWPAFIGILIVLLISILLHIWAAAIAALAVAIIFSLYCRKKIGGVTGDTLGAACEICEAVAAVAYMVQSWNAL